MSEELRYNLAYQDLGCVPYALIRDYCDFIRVIDVSNNRIREVSFLQHFAKLNSVILDHNEVSSSVEFPYLPTVNLLWMNFNEVIQLYPFIENIKKSFPNLKHLSLMGNPSVPPCTEDTYYDYIQYRLYVISWLENLEYLDDQRVTFDEKEEAFRLFKRTNSNESPTLRVTNALQNAYVKVKRLLNTSPILGERYDRQTSSVI